MTTNLTIVGLIAPMLCACAGSYPPPTQHHAEAQSAERSAREVGANNDPKAQLSLKLAQDEIVQAEKAMKEDKNEEANGLLLRARADAELAIAQAHEVGAKVAVQEAVDDSAAQKATNQGQGAIQ